MNLMPQLSQGWTISSQIQLVILTLLYQMEVQIGTMQSSFQRLRFLQQDLLDKETLFQTLKKINGQTPFDPDIFSQLWQECEQNSDGKVVIADFVAVISKAITILKNKIRSSKQQSSLLLASKNKLKEVIEGQEDYLNKHQNRKEFETATKRIYVLADDILQLETDLEIIKRLFMEEALIVQSPRKQEPVDVGDNEGLQQKLLFTLCLIGFLFELTMTFRQKGFLNLLVYGLVLALFVQKTPPKSFWLFVTVLLIISVVTDVTWGVLYGKYIWNGLHTHSQSLGLDKYCLVLTGVLLVGKVLSGILLYFTFRPTTLVELD